MTKSNSEIFESGVAGRGTRFSRWLLPLLSVATLLACDKGGSDKQADKTDKAGKKAVEPGPKTDVVEQPGTPDCAGKLPDFASSAVPTNYGGPLGTGPQGNGGPLAVFAWQHFVALNWQAGPDRRGQPYSGATFFDNPKTTVWLSYRHKNELFPGQGKAPDSNYDSAPQYNYDNLSGPCDPTTDTDPNALNNLDENSQLGLDYMFAQPTGAPDKIEILFEAKVNAASYGYVVANKLYDLATQTKYAGVTSAALDKYGAICQQSQPQMCDQTLASAEAGYCLPCGGTGSEGSIHVKAAWRKLTSSEASSGHYFTAPVVIYEPDPNNVGKVCYSNAAGETWGLVGLHIIHKTEQFPAYMFATWEHVENVASNLLIENTTSGGPPDTVGKALPWQRAVHEGKSLPSPDIQAVNTCVQTTIATENPQSVWQYYQLIGVQGTPVDYSERSTVLPDYFLANNVIESNDFFQTFVGCAGHYGGSCKPGVQSKPGPDGTMIGANVAYQGNANLIVGGCQGCHGNAQGNGTDMSFLTRLSNGASPPAPAAVDAEALGDFENLSSRAAAFLRLGSG